MRYISTYIRFWLKPCTEWCVAGLKGLEPSTSRVTGGGPNQPSYNPLKLPPKLQHPIYKNKFKIIAYERAADAVEHASSELKDLWDEGKLEDVPGIGKSIAEHLSELFSTGKSKHFEQVMQGLPKQMFDLMIVPGIGVKTAYKLVNKFKSKFKKRKAIKVLEYLAKKGEISK